VSFFVSTTLSGAEDESKIALLFQEYRSLMHYIAIRILNDHALAEDAVSESFIRLIRNIHKVGEIKCHKTRGLVVIIVTNVAKTLYNKKIKEGVGCEDEMLEIPDPSPGVPDEIIGLESYNAAVNIINALPDSLRDVADLAFVHNYDYKEIADMLNISYDNVRQRISRARRIIKDELNRKIKEGESS
jgi:RNA polymerase sigma-70 factor (ECF subfamily)